MEFEKYYTLTEIEAITNMGHTTLLLYVRDGILKAVKFGGKGKWRVSESDLKAFLSGTRNGEGKSE